MSKTSAITVAYGDGIGPEIMDATLYVLKEAKARLSIETIEVGEQVYKKGISTGIPDDAWESLRRTKVLLKSPITTPQGGGYKSLNVTMRKALGLYSNVRPCVSYHPFVKTNHPNMNLVIVRENEEDLYAGIEHRQTPDVAQTLKLITRSGSERIMRYAFEYAVNNNRKKVTCMSKDNIMKMTDGLFHRVFNEVAADYPDIATDHYIIDIGAARLATAPNRFDVIVTENLYGDIISDIAAEVSGSVGLAGSANIGNNFAMFEAIHGSAPDIAGRGIANPSGLLNGAVMMLVHLGQHDVANLIQNAWLRTLEEGIHTKDIFSEATHHEVGTMEFAKAVVDHFGENPKTIKSINYEPRKMQAEPIHCKLEVKEKIKKLMGVDMFVQWTSEDLDKLGDIIVKLSNDRIECHTIACKGLKVWPGSAAGINLTDHYRCRFHAREGVDITHLDLIGVLQRCHEAGIDCIKTENLYTFNGEPGYSLGAGE